MLDVVEKIMWGLAALAFVAIGGLFFVLGTPSTRPYIATKSHQVTENAFKSSLDDGAKAGFEAQQKEISQRQRKTGAGSRRDSYDYRQVNEEMYERVSSLNDAFREARKARSAVKTDKNGNSSLVISDFGDNNLFEKIGFEENDEIQSINGQQIDFANISKLEARKLYLTLKDEFQQGTPLSVEVLRAGKPTTLWFAPDWLGSRKGTQNTP